MPVPDAPDADLPPGGTALVDPPWDAWTPWEVARRLRGVGVRWYVAGGWAVDLHRGAVSREHGDLEIAVAGRDFPAIRDALPDLHFSVVGSGAAWPLDDARAAARMHQTWGFDRRGGVYRVDVFREPGEAEWVYRRDRSVRVPWAEAVLAGPDGVPYLAPQLVLLFKARAHRAKDDADLAAVLPGLPDGARRWLADRLREQHPGHPWIEQVGSGPRGATDG